MKAFLSGMPDVKLGLNDAVEDVTFHQCVNLGRYDAERVASFVPPDGEKSFLFFRVFFFVAEKNRNEKEISLEKKKVQKQSQASSSSCATAAPMPSPCPSGCCPS